MGRSPCCAKVGLNRGAWTAMEDKTLAEYITTHGEGKWRNLPKRAGLKRCGKSCRLRWLNYLRPDIKRGNISPEEEELIIRLHKLLGNRWSLIAGRLPGRTDNEIKNYWNTHIDKKVHDHQSSSRSHEANTTHRKPPTHPKTHHKNTNVIRTKASRCTKLFMPHQSTQTDNVTTNLHGASPFLNHDNYDPQPGYDLSTFLNYPENHVNEDNNSGDFLGEFKMDESFLSDFLNVDFSELYNDTNATAEGDGARNETNDLDFRSSMAPINDSELDWLS